MYVEIISTVIIDGDIMIEAIDVSEEHLLHIERERDDGSERELKFMFETPEAKKYLYRWLKSQKVTQGSKTWGEALHATCGTITTISGKYISWD